MNPLVSIITVTFNAAEHIELTLKSINFQTYTDYELVIVDGVSCDNTLDLIKKYSNSFSKLTIVSEVDEGIYDAMNKGIKLASGEFIVFMNAGDTFYDRDVLNSMVNACEPGCVVFGSTMISGLIDNPVEIVASVATLDDFFFRSPLCHQSILFPRVAFAALGGFDITFKVAADTEWIVRFLKEGGEFIRIETVICTYLADGFSSRSLYAEANDHKRIAERHIQYKGKSKISNTFRLRVIRVVLLLIARKLGLSGFLRKLKYG